jgi:LysM repeat protein
MQHEVKAGETLHKIASMHGVSVAAIQEVNEISDPTKIRIGTMLVIPKSGSASSAAPAVKAPAQATQTTPPRPVVAETAAAPAKPIAPAAPETTKDSGKVYEVVKGDNPVSIAKKLNVSYNELLALNKIDDPRKLQIGQKLKVPESK